MQNEEGADLQVIRDGMGFEISFIKDGYLDNIEAVNVSRHPGEF